MLVLASAVGVADRSTCYWPHRTPSFLSFRGLSTADLIPFVASDACGRVLYPVERVIWRLWADGLSSSQVLVSTSNRSGSDDFDANRPRLAPKPEAL